MIKTEIKLENGDCVQVEFTCVHYDPPDYAHGIRMRLYQFEIDYYTPYNEHTGEPCLPVKGSELQITDAIYKQLADAWEKEMEAV